MSRSFSGNDRAVCDWFRGLLAAFGDDLLEAGDRPSPPKDQVDQLINEADLLCAIVTARNGAVPEWISYEISRAHACGVPVFGFVEDGIGDLGSLPAIFTYKPFRRVHLCDRAAEHVRYICEARRSVRGSRTELIALIEELKRELELEVENRNKVFDP